MATVDRWLLPDGIEEVLPPEAALIEAARRQVLDLFQRWGYEFVVTPHIEYLESLLTGAGQDLDLRTFKVTDPLSGRQMGFRADITPQVARMDAHTLRREGPSRLCYAGSVLHAKPRALATSRSPIQLGAELYGDASPASDVGIVFPAQCFNPGGSSGGYVFDDSLPFINLINCINHHIVLTDVSPLYHIFRQYFSSSHLYHVPCYCVHKTVFKEVVKNGIRRPVTVQETIKTFVIWPSAEVR